MNMGKQKHKNKGETKMQIISDSKNLTTKDIYLLTMNPKTQKMKDCKGQRIEIKSWAIYEDVNKKTGDLQSILAIATPEGETFATNSPTFIDDFSNMWELFTDNGETVPAIVVTSGMSKAEREFISCVYSE